MAGQKGMKRYPVELKEKAVRMYFEEGYRRKDILVELEIKNDTQLEEWLRRFRAEGYAGLEYRKKGRKKKRSNDITALELLKNLR